ncbi:hypothetical protein [Flavilitoribacter nigricans]|uniref:Uncharacterized protein n=1 Tax=Flavilitoribacter nigricans (strain ATCC 23147 / DSM 23189 / NBRC 102662 / NCIMB 1420 / SS-2) TaxID=1122177 RepID=A0A2D0MZM3_FLAN2|nr:hypothetical protein [Flavilitoribacter nigricans]PHN01695.1 hypothetical protein CRP01_35700 [Flavilitoribacter nigricans DSM 23189 = NBRC 102662]
MLKAKAYFYSFLLIALTAACGVETDSSAPEVSATPFFKLEAYFDREIARMDSLQPTLQKMVTVDGASEEQRIESTDYQKEFQIFRRSDINRPSWIDKYQVDSLRENGGVQIVNYTALDTSLNTRLLRVSYRNNEVEEIQIRNRSKSAIASTEQDLWYRPGRSYRIESRQKTIGSDPREVLIDVEIRK